MNIQNVEIEEMESLANLMKGVSRKELVDLIGLTDNWSTNKDTKFHLYQPTDIAKKFHSSQAKTRFLAGGNRSSKTYTNVMEFASQFTGEAPPSLVDLIPQSRLDSTRRLRLCMGDYPNSFVKVIWPYIKQLIPSDYIQDVVKEAGRVKAITNPSGGFIEFMQYDQLVTKFQGSSRHAIGYDEEPPEDIRDENLMRLVDTDGEETFSLTPISGALKYLYDKVFLNRSREVEKDYNFVLNSSGRLIDAIPGDIRDVSIPGGDPDIHCFFACIFDNPAIPKKAAIRILSKFPKEEMIVRGKGHFLFLSGLVYKEYNDATHLIPSFSDWHRGKSVDDYTLYLAIDPHPRTPHAVLFLVARSDGLLFIVDELFVDCTATQLVEAVKVKCMGKTPEAILIDPLANTPDPSTKSCLTYDLINAGMDNPMPMSGSKDRSHAITKSRELLVSNDRGVPGIYITDNCTRFRYEITRWAWDDWRKDTQNIKGEKQKPIDKDDHMLENFGRLVLLNPEWKEPREEDETLYVSAVIDNSYQQGRSRVTGY